MTDYDGFIIAQSKNANGVIASLNAKVSAAISFEVVAPF